ncbi:ComEA family DNA-binding protein [Candidatus Omnitrophota bacterium]
MLNLTKEERLIVVFIILSLLIGIGVRTAQDLPVAPTGGRASFEDGGRREGGMINVNKASAQELSGIKGIGRVLAGRIVEYRKANGPFVEKDELMKVKGIGDGMYGRIKERISLE